MTRIALSVILLFVPSVPLSAHGSSTLPEPGQDDISTFWVPVGGMHVDMWWVEDAYQAITRFGFHAVTARFNAGGAGLNSMIEIGIVPGLSAGVEVNVPDLFVAGLQGGNYFLDLALSCSLQLVTKDWFGLQTRLEVEAEPLFGARSSLSLDDGYINFFLTLGASARLHESGKSALWVYLDTKAVTSLENPAYRTPVGTFERMLGLPPGSTTGLPAQTGPIFKVAVATGLEIKLNRFIFHAGFNLPVVSFHRYYVTSIFFSGFDLGIDSLEFSWRYRL